MEQLTPENDHKNNGPAPNVDLEATRALAIMNTSTIIAAMFTMEGAPVFLNKTASTVWAHLPLKGEASLRFCAIFSDPEMGDFILELLSRQDVFSDELLLQTIHGDTTYACTFSKVVDPINSSPTIALVAKTMPESWVLIKQSEEKTNLLRSEELLSIEEAKLAAQHEKLSAAAARQLFCATASHELRTPVQSLTTCLELIKKMPFVQPEWVAEASDAIHQMNETLHDLVDFVRVDAEEPTKQKIVDIDTFIHRTLANLAKRATAKQLGFQVTIRPSAKIHAQLYEGRVRQVLVNIVGNAIKYTRSGSVNIDVRHVQDLLGADFPGLEIVVSDTGAGMALETISSLMLPFTRGISGRKMDKQGLGLGLAIVQTHLLEMGGSIAIVPNASGGTDVQIVIPCKQTQTT